MIASAPFKMKAVNGWMNPLNLGAFGTVVAWLGLGALTAKDAVNPSAFVDGDSKRLDFSKKDAMHFEKDQMLPCNATWSISIYEGNFYARNAINNYAVSPWMPLQYNADGSLVYVQPESPGADKEANWLPSPPGGPMNLTIRCYWPKEPLLNGSYRIPPLKLVQ